MSYALTDLMRTIHVLAGGAWVGGSLMYLLVIGPAFRLTKPAPEVSAQVARLFRQLVNICIGALLLTGVYLIFDRLSLVTIGAAYLVVLVVKVVAALAMFVLALFQAQEARRPAKQRGRWWRQTPRYILALGVLTFLLGTTLTVLFEYGLMR
jgi:putative copper export protein